MIQQAWEMQMVAFPMPPAVQGTDKIACCAGGECCTINDD
jgi:hypothetical protein